MATICSLQFKRLQMEGDENTLLQMFARIREKGYIVEVCGEKIYEESVFNVSAECFFVHRGVAPMEIRSRKKYFSCDTEGCFLNACLAIIQTSKSLSCKKVSISGINLESL